MFTETTNNMFDCTATAYVNPVNCRGVSGAGIAKTMKQRYPAVVDEYEKLCSAGILRPGDVFPVMTHDLFPRLILFFATKDDWRDPSRYGWIEQCLVNLKRLMTRTPLGGLLGSVVIPPIGCGHGGLDWGIVKSMIRESLAPIGATNFILTSYGSVEQ